MVVSFSRIYIVLARPYSRHIHVTKRQDKNTTRQKDRKTKRQKDKKIERKKDKKAKGQKGKKTKRQKGQKDQKKSLILWCQGTFILLRCFVGSSPILIIFCLLLDSPPPPFPPMIFSVGFPFYVPLCSGLAQSTATMFTSTICSRYKLVPIPSAHTTCWSQFDPSADTTCWSQLHLQILLVGPDAWVTSLVDVRREMEWLVDW